MDTCTHTGREDGKNSVCVRVLCRASGGLVGGPEMFGEVRSHGGHSFSSSSFPSFFRSLFSSSSQHNTTYIILHV